MLLNAPSAVSNMMRALKCKNLPKCFLYYSLLCTSITESALSKAHGHHLTHFVLICCELATMHEYIQRVVEDTEPYTSLPALTCMIGLLIVRVIWLGLMLTEQQNARCNSRHTARCRIDHPKCANGKYWGRIRYGQRKFLSKGKQEVRVQRNGLQTGCTNCYSSLPFQFMLVLDSSRDGYGRLAIDPEMSVLPEVLLHKAWVPRGAAVVK